MAQEDKPGTAAAGSETAPVLLSRSDLENCPNTFVSATRVEGTTRVRALIDPSGQPTEVTVMASSGFQPLDEAAVTCFKKARFQPAVRAGKPAQAPFEMGVKWEIPPGAQTCSPSMPIAWIVDVSVGPSPRSPAPDPTPAGASALVCGCADGREPMILRSSGSSHLDDGAIKLMKKAGERQGSRVSWCYAEEFRFTPENAAHSEGGS